MTLLITSQEEQQMLVEEMHEGPEGGHLSVQHTYDRLRRFVTWPSMFRGVEDYVIKCEICLKNIRLLLYTAISGGYGGCHTRV